jgi:hypothetical protein
MKTSTLTRVNEVAIQIVENNNEKFVPIRPICEALGIDDKSQRSKIYEDEFLNSVKVLSTSTGTDGKEYEMLCRTFRY